MLAGEGSSESSNDEWHPRTRLRDLKGIHIRLSNSDTFSAHGSFFSLALWTLLKQSKAQDQAQCLAYSHQVLADSPTTWVPLELAPAVDTELLHSLASGCIHIHIYSSCNRETVEACKHESVASQQRIARGPAKSPLHDADCVPRSEEDSSDSDLEYRASESHQRMDSAHLVGFKQRRSTEPLQPVPFQLCQKQDSRSHCLTSCDMKDSEVCLATKLPGQLLWSLTLDLAALSPRMTASMSDYAEDDASLVFEFKNGSQAIWPPQKHNVEAPIIEDMQQASSSNPEDGVNTSGTWMSIFRRASLPDGPPQERQPSTSSTSTPIRGLEGLRHNDEGKSTNWGPTRTSISSEVQFSQLEGTIHLLSKLQSRREHLQAKTAMTEHKLHEAIRIRQRREKQEERLARLKSDLTHVKQKAIRATKQRKMVQANCRNARHLMSLQNDHLTIACSKLEDFWLHHDGPASTFNQTLRTELSGLHRQLVARRCRLVADVQSIYRIQPKKVSVLEKPGTGFLWHRLNQAWAEVPITSKPRASLQPRAPAQEAQPQLPQFPVQSSGRQAISTADDSADETESVISTLSGVSIDTSTVRSVAKLAIASLPLESSMARQKSEGLVAVNWQSEQEQDDQLTAALGYTVHLVKHVADYLSVSLKFPLIPANSRSSVLSHQEPIQMHARSRDDSAATSEDEMRPVEYPLHSEKIAPARYAHALHLLNKDVEQLVSMHGLSLSTPSQILHNLHKLLTAGASAVPDRQLIAPTGSIVQNLQHDGTGHFT